MRAALARYPADTEVVILTRDGRDGDLQPTAHHVRDILDGLLAHRPQLVAVLVRAIKAEDVRQDFAGLRAVIARLRDPEDGCPWDLAQDHQSLRPHLLEETYEVLEALDRGDAGSLREELGDLLMQVVLHAQIAEQAGDFDFDDVSEGIRAKLVHRHPHVFADVDAATPDEVAANWEVIKSGERDADASALDGVPTVLPSLARAHSLAGRAARHGFAWPNDDAVLDKLQEELRELAAVEANDEGGRATEEFGDLLFVIADFARRHAINPEDALRIACSKFERRFRALETSLRADGAAVRETDHEALLRRWDDVKAAER
jgi:MazG family protein